MAASDLCTLYLVSWLHCLKKKVVNDARVFGSHKVQTRVHGRTSYLLTERDRAPGVWNPFAIHPLFCSFFRLFFIVHFWQSILNIASWAGVWKTQLDWPGKNHDWESICLFCKNRSVAGFWRAATTRGMRDATARAAKMRQSGWDAVTRRR